ncbi:MAG TPA: hypothetical protein ENK78_08460 [Thiothrix sp.]|nr:hypothetical protein [Thiothrix sp.]
MQVTMPFFLSGAAMIMFSSHAYAACNNSETLFSCTTTNNKLIELCDAKKTINYTFGKVGKKPELRVAAVRDKVTTWQWHGVGRYMSYSVTVPNGDYKYRVFWGVDRLSPKAEEEAGVDVEKNGKLLATVKCKADTITQHLEGVELRSDDD